MGRGAIRVRLAALAALTPVAQIWQVLVHNATQSKGLRELERIPERRSPMSKPTFANVVFWCVAAAGAVALNLLVLAVAGVLPGGSGDAPALSTEAGEAPVTEPV